MFVNIASGSNSCQVEDRTDLSPGIDPCPELPVRAGVWHFSATTLGQTLASGTHFASELRNMNALAINPADGKLYGAQNGRDQLFDNWSTFFDERDDAMLPAEELFVIEQGKKYGWPYCYYDGVKNKKVLAPEYGGDGAKVGRCADRELPLADYPAHWAPLGMTFYTGTQFPSRYLGGCSLPGTAHGLIRVSSRLVRGTSSRSRRGCLGSRAGSSRPLPMGSRGGTRRPREQHIVQFP
jgi:hypothetical protein